MGYLVCFMSKLGHFQWTIVVLLNVSEKSMVILISRICWHDWYFPPKNHFLLSILPFADWWLVQMSWWFAIFSCLAQKLHRNDSGLLGSWFMTHNAQRATNSLQLPGDWINGNWQQICFERFFFVCGNVHWFWNSKTFHLCVPCQLLFPFISRS